MYCYLKPLGLNSIHPLGFHVCPMLCQACAAPSMISPVAAVEATVFVGWRSYFSATLQFGDFEYFGTLKNSICNVLISNQIDPNSRGSKSQWILFSPEVAVSAGPVFGA